MSALTFWAQTNPYTSYQRCEMPAKVLGAQVRNLDVVVCCGLDPLEVNDGAAIWQILCNGARLSVAHKMMSHSIPQFVEVDDDYLDWDPRYANTRWVRDMPDPRDPNAPIIPSVELHRRLVPTLSGVIVATPWLAEVYSEYNHNVHVCPNQIDPDDWRDPTDRDETFRVMWMASSSHRTDDYIIMNALDWAGSQEDCEAILWGPPFAKDNVVHVSWVPEPQSYRDKLVALRPDLGVCPVEQNRWTRSKSDLKALEYAMAGACPVVTRFDPYAPWLPMEGEACLVASTPGEWAEVIRWAVDNRDEVRRMAARAREYVLAERTISANAHKWLEAVGAASAVLA